MSHNELMAAWRIKEFELDNAFDSFDAQPSFHLGDDNLNNYQCGAGTVMTQWLSLPSVQEALHVIPNTNGFKYSMTAANLLPLYAELMKVRIPAACLCGN